MKRISMKVLGIGIILALFMPGIALAHPSGGIQKFVHGNEYVMVNGKSVTLGIGNENFGSSWVLYQVTQNRTTHINPNIVNVSHIVNTHQNSVILIEATNSIKVAEIYTFYNSEIDASIAITNLARSPVTILADYVLTAAHQNHQYSHSLGFPALNSTLSKPGIFKNYILSPYNFDLYNRNYSVNWEGESNVYQGGIFSSAPFQDTLSLPFGLITMVHNETYSIDPVISNTQKETVPSTNTASSSSGVGTITQMPDSSSGYTYNSNGCDIVFDTATLKMNNAIQECYYTGLYMAAQILPYSSDGFTVNQICQEVTWITDNYSTPYCWSMNMANNYYQDHVQNSISNLSFAVTVLTDAANAAGIPIPNVAYFLKYTSGISDKAVTNGYQVSANAGTTYYCGGYGYNPLGYSYGFLGCNWVTSYWFASQLMVKSGYLSGLTYPTTMNDLFHYTLNYEVTGPNEQHLYAGGNGFYFVLGEYQYP